MQSENLNLRLNQRTTTNLIITQKNKTIINAQHTVQHVQRKQIKLLIILRIKKYCTIVDFKILV